MNILKMRYAAGLALLSLPSLAGAQAMIPNYEFSSVAVDYPVNAATNPTYSLQGTLGQTFATVDPPTNSGQTLAYAGFQQTYVPFAYFVQISLDSFTGNTNPGVIYGQGVNIPFFAETFDIGNTTTPADAPSQPFFADATGKIKVFSTLNSAFAGTIAVKGPIWLRQQGAITQPADPINGYPMGAPLVLPAGDSNNDNAVDVLDFGNLVNAYGSNVTVPTSGYDPTTDFNQDGSVDVLDFASSSTITAPSERRK